MGACAGPVWLSSTPRSLLLVNPKRVGEDERLGLKKGCHALHYRCIPSFRV